MVRLSRLPISFSSYPAIPRRLLSNNPSATTSRISSNMTSVEPLPIPLSYDPRKSYLLPLNKAPRSKGKWFPDPSRIYNSKVSGEGAGTKREELEGEGSEIQGPVKEWFRVDEQRWFKSTHLFPGAYPRSVLRSARPVNGASSYQGQGREVKVDPPFFDWTKSSDTQERNAGMWNVQQAEAQRWLEWFTKQDGVPVFPPEHFSQSGLWIVVNRYFPETTEKEAEKERQDNGVTFLLAHANGLHKETFEPFLQDMITSRSANYSAKDPLPPICEIFTFDAVQQGDSGVVNDEVLGDAFHWGDNARDILQFLLSYIPTRSQRLSLQASSPSSSTTSSIPSTYPFILPYHDPPNGEKEMLALDGWKPSKNNIKIAHGAKNLDGWFGRRIIGFGHSFGGGAMSLVASSPLFTETEPNPKSSIATTGTETTTTEAAPRPRPFEMVILLDPVLQNPEWDRGKRMTKMTVGAVKRRDRWSVNNEDRSDNERVGIKEFVRKNLIEKEFFRIWDGRALQSYVEDGMIMVEDKRGGEETIRLKCRREHEALVFADPVVSLPYHLLPANPPTSLEYSPSSTLWALSAYLRISQIPPSLPTKILFASPERSALPDEHLPIIREFGFRNSGSRDKKQLSKDGGTEGKGTDHLMVQDDPKGVAQVVGEWLGEWWKVERGDEIDMKKQIGMKLAAAMGKWGSGRAKM